MANTHKINTDGLYLKLNPRKEYLEGHTAEEPVVRILQAPTSNTPQTFQSQSESDQPQRLPDGSQFELLDEGLGFECRYVHIKIGETEYYILRDFIERLPGTKEFLQYSCRTQPSISLEHEIDWTEQEFNKAYHDNHLQKWCVPVESEHFCLGSDSQARLDEHLKAGLRIILEENGKDSDDERLDIILSRFITAKAEDHFIDPRATAKMKVLVTLSDKYIPPLPEIPRELAYINIQPNYTISLFADEYERDIKQAATIMEDYAASMELFAGTIKNVDLRVEAEKLRDVYRNISHIIFKNNINLSDGMIIELGIGENGECISISENSTGDYRKLMKGTVSISEEPPFDSPRTMSYMQNLSEIINTQEGDKPWSDFLKEYTFFPTAEIFPSKMWESSTDTVFFGPQFNENTNPTATQVDNMIKDAYSELGVKNSCNPNSAKTKKEKEKEEALLDRFKRDVSREALNQVDYVGEQIFKDLNVKLSKIKSLSDVYTEILSKICLKDLLGLAMLCIETPTLSDEMKRFKDRLPPVKVCLDRKKNCWIPTIKLPSLPSGGLMKNFREEIYKAIIEMLTQIFVEMVKDIIEALKSICDKTNDESEGAGEQAPNLNNQIGDLLGTAGPDGLPSGLSDLFDDLSMILSARELCTLLSGSASKKTISIVKSLVQASHPSLSDMLRTNSSIINFFIKLGNVVNISGTNFCEDFSEFSTPPSISCDDPFSANESLYNALSEKNCQITSQEIEEQIKKAKDRRAQKLDKIATIIEMLATDENPFQSLVPEMLGENGLINLTHPSSDHLQSVVLEGLFTGVRRSFNRDAEQLKNSLIDDFEGEVEVPITITIEYGNIDPTTMTHPDIQKLLSNGITMEQIKATAVYEDGEPGYDILGNPIHPNGNQVFNAEGIRLCPNGDLQFVEEWLPGQNTNLPGVMKQNCEDWAIRSDLVNLNMPMIKVPRRENRTSRKLISMLSSLESESAFVEGSDEEGFYYEMTISKNSGMANIIASMAALDDRFKDLLEALEAEPSWKIRYKVPYMTAEGDDSEIDDDYIAEVFLSNDILGGFRKVGTGTIDPEVLNFINVDLGADSGIEINLSDHEVDQTTLTVPETFGADAEACLPPPAQQTLTTTKYTPPPQAVFGRHIGKLWEEALAPVIIGNDYNPALLENFKTSTEKHFSQELYPKVSRDLLSLIASQVSKSPLLVDLEKQEDIFGVDTTVYYPRWAEVSLKRTQTVLEKACNIDPHLLKIENYKSEVAKNIAKIDPHELLSEMNSSGTDPVNLAVLKSVVKMTIRAYCFDYALRGLYMLTEFAMEASIDDYVKEFLTHEILSEMEQYNSTYPVVMSELANEIYAEMIGVDIDNPVIETTTGIKHLVGQTLEEVFVDLKCSFRQKTEKLLEYEEWKSQRDTYRQRIQQAIFLKNHNECYLIDDTELEEFVLREINLEDVKSKLIDVGEDVEALTNMTGPQILDVYSSITGKSISTLVSGLESIGSLFQNTAAKYSIMGKFKAHEYKGGHWPRETRKSRCKRINEYLDDSTVEYNKAIEWIADFQNTGGIAAHGGGYKNDFVMNSKSVKEKLVEDWLPLIELPSLREDGTRMSRFTDIGDLLSEMTTEIQAFIADSPIQQAILNATIDEWLNIRDVELPPLKERAEQRAKTKEPGATAEDLRDIFDTQEQNLNDYTTRVQTAINYMGDSNANTPGTAGMLDEDGDARYIDCECVLNPGCGLISTWGQRDGDDDLRLQALSISGRDFPQQKTGARCEGLKAYKAEQEIWVMAYDNWVNYRGPTPQGDYWESSRVILEEYEAKIDELTKAEEAVAEAQANVGEVTNAYGESINVKDSINISPEDLRSILTGDITLEQIQHQGIPIKQKFGSLASVVENGEIISFDLNNGNFFLERSIRFQRAGFPAIKKKLIALGADEDKVGIFTNEFNTIFKKYVHGTTYDEDMHDTSAHRWGYASKDDLISFLKEWSYTLITSSNVLYNIGLLDDIEVIDGPLSTLLDMSTYFDSFSPELRLMYIPPVKESQFKLESTSVPGFDSLIETLRLDTTISDAINDLGNISKAFYAKETEERETGSFINGQFIVSGEKETIQRDVYPIPLVDTSRSVNDRCGYSDWLTKSISDITDLDSGFFEFEYKKSIRELKERLIDSTEFKMLFDFVFPVDRYLSMITVYNILASSSVGGVENSFDTTKDQLYNLYQMTHDTDFMHVGDSPQEFQELAEDFSDLENCFSFDGKSVSYEDLFKGKFESNFNMPENPFKGKGFSMITDNAKEVGMKIFKSFTESVDPNIKAARAIKKISKSVGFCGDREIPLWLISFGLLPPFLPFPPPPVGPGLVQFTLTPFGLAYLFGWSWDRKSVNYFSAPPSANCDEVDTCIAPTEEVLENLQLGDIGPVLKINTLLSATVPNKRPDFGAGRHIVTVDSDTEDAFAHFSGVLSGFSGENITGRAYDNYIVLHQGVERIGLSSTTIIDNDLKETQYKIEIDNRFGELDKKSRRLTWNTPAPEIAEISNNIVSYYVKLEGPDEIVTNLNLTEKSVVIGPRGTKVWIQIRASAELSGPNVGIWHSEGSEGTTMIDGTAKRYKYIDSSIRVTGADTGVSLYVPIRYVKYQPEPEE